jgi:acetate kinase
MPNPQPASPVILTINGGSSSIKFAVFESATPPKRLFSGQVERIGTPGARLITTRDGAPDTRPIEAATFSAAAQCVLGYLRERVDPSAIGGIGHRIVNGGVHLLEHKLLTEDLIAELRRLQPLDLSHLPREIALIDAFRTAFPTVPQLACFDTAFHRDLPHVAQLLAIPRKYLDAGVRRLGFHGLSYTYLMSRLAAVAGPEAADDRIILAHLGSGASMAAVYRGKPVDTTMSFTPTAGLVMGTRPGDIDPGLMVYLMKEEKLSADGLDKFISEQCGLLGVSGTTSDMRDLVNRRATDPRAADAFALFCYQAKKFIGALFTVLGGLDTLVFSGGIGENSAEARAGICEGLDCLGIEIDPQLNAAATSIISRKQSRVTVRVIPTDEEFTIAEAVWPFIQR